MFSGQLRKAREFSRQAADLAERRNLNEVASQIAVAGAVQDALFGECRDVKTRTAKALGITIPPHLLILADEVIQ